MSDLTLVTVSWAAGFALVSAVITFFVTRNSVKTGLNLVLSAALAYAVNTAYIYLFTPSMVGWLWGQAAMLWPLLFLIGIKLASWGISAAREGGRYSDAPTKGSAGLATYACLGVGVVLFSLVSYLSIYAYYGWGTKNVHEWGKLANVEVMPETERLPATDPDRIQAVTAGMAYYKCHTAISKGGEALSSFFDIRKKDIVRQAIGKRTYFAAPLTPTSELYQFMGWTGDSPAFCVVDSEDPNLEAEIVTDQTIKVWDGGYWGRSLQRHVYFSGYHHCNLDDPTFELDENRKPFATMTCTRPKFVVGGEVMHSMVVVNLSTGAITDYKPDQVPAWIDRVMSDEIVNEYTSNWGLYSHPDVSWLFNGGRNQKRAASMGMVFNSTNEAFWEIPMKSVNGGNSSATGILLYSTRENHARYYPGLRGIPVGDAVIKAFQEAKGNVQKYPVREVALYGINGHVTYVAIYVQDQGSKGETFAGIGFMSAHQVAVNNVIFASSKAEALARYSVWLGNANVNDVEFSRDSKLTKPVTGVVFRVGRFTQSGAETFTFLLQGDGRVFTISLDGYPNIPLVQAGDRVEFSIIDTGQNTVAVAGFKDLTIEEALSKK